MGTPRSPLRVVILRVVLYALALLLTLGASIIIARRLSASEYAAYQFATKRIIQYSTIPISFFGLWMYRYLAVRKRGSLGASYLLTLVVTLLGAVLGLALELYEARVLLATALAASAAMAAQSALGSVTTIIDALRPVRQTLSVLTYRFLYFVAVIVALYVLRPSLVSLFAATAAAMTVTFLVELLWVSQVASNDLISGYKDTLMVWARTSEPLIIGYIVGWVSSLDVMVAYSLANPEVVAAFFVAASVATLIRESSNVGLRYLQLYGLTGGQSAESARTLMLLLSLVAPLLVYAAFYSRYVVYVFNPMYSWAAPMMSAFMAIALLEIVNGGLYNMALGSIPVDESNVRALRSYMIWTSFSSVIYVALLAALMGVLRFLSSTNIALLAAWSVAYGARFLSSVAIIYSRYIDEQARGALRAGLPRLAAYLAIAVALSAVVRPWEPPQRGLLDSVAVLLPPLLIYLAAYYAILIGVDKNIRRLVTRMLRSPALALGLEA